MSAVDDDDTQQDMFNASDEEHAEDNLEVEKWRLERHEREKFISEQVSGQFQGLFKTKPILDRITNNLRWSVQSAVPNAVPNLNKK